MEVTCLEELPNFWQGLETLCDGVWVRFAKINWGGAGVGGGVEWQVAPGAFAIYVRGATKGRDLAFAERSHCPEPLTDAASNGDVEWKVVGAGGSMQKPWRSQKSQEQQSK